MNQNFLIRPVQESDLTAILAIAGQTGPGFNSLPDNAVAIKDKIARSIKSFAEKLDPKNQFFFFVMENLNNQEVVGTAAIEACIGFPWPFYRYKISTLVRLSQSIHRSIKMKVLQLVSDHQEASELCALFLKPHVRGEGRGTFLSRARCLFIAEFPKFFANYILADMRGVSNAEAISPFWEAVGTHFFDMSYKDASYLKATEGAQFITELMPEYPVYLNLLPQSAKKVIGITHEATSPAFNVLQKEGFRYRRYVDLFDAGPTIECFTKDLKTLNDSKKAVIADIKETVAEGPVMMICNTKLDFRSMLGLIELTTNQEVILEKNLAEKLKVSVGESIRYCPLK